MLPLSFNQKVWLGFIIILVLLTISGVSSLWNLNDISNSNARVNETAVPVVREANQVQIELLKLANLSALGFNARKEEDIHPYRTSFEEGTKKFAELYKSLESLTASDPAMKSLVTDIKTNYDDYIVAVREMFDSKLAVLVAKEKADVDVEEVINLVSDLGGALMEIVYFSPPEKFEKDFELASGNANQADGLFVGIIKLAQELQRTTDMERLNTANDDFRFIIDAGERYVEISADIFRPMDESGFIEDTEQKIEELKSHLAKDNTLVTYKKEQLKQEDAARVKLDVAKESVGKSVAGLDDLLASADKQFVRLQSELTGSLDFGLKSAGIIMIVLLVLASQNFNSMRLAIRKKMIDLAKLNKIGGTLAAARDQSTALSEVLHAMYDKIGIDKGSVYLFNKNQDLEAKAFLPPLQTGESPKAITFTKGEGVIGKAAETKKSIFVPDTSKDKSYVSRADEKAKALLCVPLVDKDMLIGVMNFSGDVKNVAFADSDYEFVSSVAVSLVTTIKNIRMVEVIEEHNRNLEKKVEERTVALKQKNDDIANMLSNMHQGLFTIVEGGLIHPEYAAYLETIFETSQIANRNFVDLLFSNATLSADVVDSATTAVSSIVGEDTMMYEFNSHLLVSELTLQFPDLPNKLIELDWDPIIDADDIVMKLMVTVRDVTALKALEAEAEGQKQELMMIGEVLAVDADKFSEFIDGSSKFVDKCRAIIQETPNKDAKTLAELFRNIHTVKGNARTYGLKYITDTVHHIENTYDQLRKNEEMEWHPTELLGELSSADEAIKRYSGIFSEKLGRSGGAAAGGGARLDPQQVASLMEKITALTHTELPENVVSIVSDTYKTLMSIEAKPIDQVIKDVIQSVQSLSVELGKAQPEFKIDNGDLYIRSMAHSMLNNIFMHVMRNAIDHGIEGNEERISKGKPEHGTISISTTEKDGMVSFAVKDDGKGLALTRIYGKAVEQGIYPANGPRPAASEIANLIFSSGFSTAEAVTEVSGRGVGMDAVQQFLNSEGGSIEVILDPGDENADFRGFTTVIRLPEKFYIIPPAFARAS